MQARIDPVKRAVTMLGLGTVLFLVGIIVLGLNLRWTFNVLRGPTPIKLEDLDAVKTPEDLSNQWVSFTFDNAIDTGLGIVSKRGGRETPRSRFLLIQVKDRWLIADVPAKHEGNQVVGYVETWSVPLRRESMDKIRGKFPNHQMMPFQLNAEYAQRTQCFSMLGIVAACLIIGAVLAGMGVFGLVFKPSR
jgi:hypothetical protein